MLLLASYFITRSSLPDLGFCLERLPSPPGSLNSPTRPFLIIPNLHVTCSYVSVQPGHRSEGSPGRPANWRALLRSQPAPQPHSRARTWGGVSLAWRSRQDAATCPVSLLNPCPTPHSAWEGDVDQVVGAAAGSTQNHCQMGARLEEPDLLLSKDKPETRDF